jgi:hypothetical protein
MNTDTIKQATDLLNEYTEHFETYTLEDGDLALVAHWHHGGQKTFLGMTEVLRWIDEHSPEKMKGKIIQIKRNAPDVSKKAVNGFICFLKSFIEVILWLIAFEVPVIILLCPEEFPQVYRLLGAFGSLSIVMLFFYKRRLKILRKRTNPKRELSGIGWSFFRITMLLSIIVSIFCFFGVIGHLSSFFFLPTE